MFWFILNQWNCEKKNCSKGNIQSRLEKLKEKFLFLAENSTVDEQMLEKVSVWQTVPKIILSLPIHNY